eukprot:COSAG02_NODE_12620_length_1518_cov_1.078929_1_plen_52_part_10
MAEVQGSAARALCALVGAHASHAAKSLNRPIARILFFICRIRSRRKKGRIPS